LPTSPGDFELEYRLMSPTGGPVSLLTRGTVLLDSAGRGRKVVGMVQDVTERKRQERLLRETERIGGLGSWEYDQITQRLTWSDQYGCLLGYEPGEVAADIERFTEHLHPDDRDRVLQEIAALRAAPGEFDTEFRMLKTDGTIVLMRSKGRMLADAYGRPVKLIGINQDITEQRRVERELRLAKEQAEQASRAKSEFLANMSHELRTPLNAILGYAEMLQEEAAELGEAAFVEDLGKIRGAGKHLLALIEDVLALAQLDAGRLALQVELVDWDALLAALDATGAALAAGRGLGWWLAPPAAPPRWRADTRRLSQCLGHLLSNAAKFTQQGAIGLRIRQTDDTLRFEVVDTGIGIEPAQQATLFEDFTQADASPSRRYGGTGLGLAITRRLMRLMGGEVTLESRPGAGSTVTLTWPLGEPGPESAAG
jgi:PAS domain S-box-containing protein